MEYLSPFSSANVRHAAVPAPACDAAQLLSLLLYLTCCKHGPSYKMDVVKCGKQGPWTSKQASSMAGIQHTSGQACKQHGQARAAWAFIQEM
eukprot:1157266-Pelagomonas_calceolata.AAC.5